MTELEKIIAGIEKLLNDIPEYEYGPPHMVMLRPETYAILAPQLKKRVSTGGVELVMHNLDIPIVCWRPDPLNPQPCPIPEGEAWLIKLPKIPAVVIDETQNYMWSRER
ncbi:MAG: hypothetical protein ABR999_10560 [Methanoregula sp.]|uniref:hypothetical protein n=1 Tax=Methanoregula sp. TaxID=2052170 RepID=UPI003D0BFF9F